MALDTNQKRYAIVLAVIVLAGAVFTFYSLQSDKQAEKDPNAPAELTKFTDEEAGFSVSYPKSWVNLTDRSNEQLVRLLVGPEGVDDSLMVQVIPLPGTVVINANTPKEDMAALEATFDQIIDRSPGLIEVAEKNRININGTQGWYYLYRFSDKATGKNGIHFKYFLFQGDTQYDVTFQIFPEDHFADMAPVFDQIIETFNFKLGRPSPRASVAASSVPGPSASPSA